MKKRILTLLLAVCLLAEAEAQHCGWDFTSIIMVDVKQKGGDEAIDGLKVTLVDSAGRCISTNNDSCVTFAQNIPTDNTDIHYVRRWNLKYGRPSFFFLEEQYLVLVYSRLEKGHLYVKVEDIDGEDNGGYFETVIAPVKEENFISLCGKDLYPGDGLSWVETAKINIELGDLITFSNRKERGEAQGAAKNAPLALLCVCFAFFAVKQS